MSVCRKLPDGTVQKIAGHTILLDANASEIREGNVSIPSIPDSSAKTVTVTFSDPMPDTNYAVDISFNGNLNPMPQFSIENKTTTGFTIYLIRPITTATPALTAHYTAWKPVKIEGYTALQNKVENPDSTPTIDSMNLVTSDGVARAIENASAVWKGTKAAWEALPSADKLKYDLAVLLDETLVKAVDRTDGTETDVANLNKIIHLTKAEYDAMPSHDPDTYYMITDDTTTMSPGYPKPDWANAVTLVDSIGTPAGFTAPSDGLIIICGHAAEQIYSKLTVNNNTVGYALYTEQLGYVLCVQCPVSKGDIIKHTTVNGSPAAVYTIGDLVNYKFVPWK